MSQVMTKEKSIIFSGPGVRAIIEGRKTQTRRLARKPVKHPDYGNLCAPGALTLECEPQHVIDRCCPYGAPGDRLWVREVSAECTKGGGHIIYKADNEGIGTCHVHGGRWRSPIHMPRWASRILLEVAEVRVERLQDVSEEDAIAEGFSPSKIDDGCALHHYSAARYFHAAWNELNGKRAPWESNPWVWAIAFKVLEVRT